MQALADATANRKATPSGGTRTDAEGRFQASLDPAGPAVAIRIEPAGLPWIELQGPWDPAETVRLPDLDLPAAEAVAGSVVGADGKAVSGACVVVRQGAAFERDDPAFFAEATTGSDGTFRIANAPRAPARLFVRGSGWPPAERFLRADSSSLRIALERGTTISGTVLDASGRPVAGTLVRSGGAAAEADAQGRYRLDGVPAGLQRVEASAPGGLVARKGGVRVAAAPVSADLQLQAGATIAGTVVDALTRRPIAGTRIAVAESPGSGIGAAEPSAFARSDAKGRFSAAGLLPADYEVRAAKTGYLPATLPRVPVSARAAAPVALALVPAASIAGKVVDAQGKSVAGAHVSLEPPRGGRGRFGLGGLGGFRGPRPDLSTRTGPDGAFRLEGLPAIPSGVPLTASHAGFAPAERPGVTLKAGQALTGIVLVLPAGLAVRGRVVDESSQPVAGAEIRVAPSEGRSGPARFLRRFFGGATPPNAVTGEDGSFTVAGLAAGAWDVTAAHDGFSPKTSSALPAPAKQPTGWPAIVLSRGGAVSGVVRDDQGAPIVGAMVSLFGEGADSSPTATDATGAFRIGNLAKGRPLMLAATEPGFATSSRSVTPPAEDVALVLGKSGTIRGKVVDGATSAPITAFSVGASPAARGRRGFGGGNAGAAGLVGGSPAQSFYADDGSFELSIGPGSWNVRATADGYRPADVSNIDLDAGETKEGVEIALNRGGGLTGHVVDNRGNPVSGANVACCSAGGGGGFGGGGASSGPTATTDGDGRFQLDGLSAGHVTLTVSSSDYVTASRDVDPAATPDVTLSVSTGAEITGAVVSGNSNSPISGSSVSLVPEGDSGTATGSMQNAQSDGNGGFHFDHLAAGRYRLTAQTKTASSTPQDLVVADGQPMDGVRVTVASGSEIDGVVTGLPSGQLGGVNVSATSTGFQSSVTTSDDGHFTIANAPSGVVRITASTTMPSVRTVAKTVEIGDDGSPASVEMGFDGASRLSGNVTQGGKPVTQFAISATPHPPDGSGRRYTAMSDGTGHYEIDNMMDGGYDVVVSGSDSPYRTTLTVSGDTNGDIAMPATTVSGTVTDSSSGAPLEGASVQAETGSESTAQSVHRTVTDSTGAYTLSGLDSGTYQVSARKDGYQLKTLPATVGSDPANLDFALDPGAGLSIRATDGVSGMPLGGLIALAFGAGGTIAFQGSVALDGTGAGQIPSLPPGRYALYVFSAGYASRAFPSVTVPSAPVTVTLTPGGSVQARATAPLSGRIVDGGGNPVLLGPNRLDGRVVVAPPITVWLHLAPGGYAFLVPAGTGETPYSFTVSEGQTTTLSLP
jgi:protocatechuate 3,4-dioxygenase beta subunit